MHGRAWFQNAAKQGKLSRLAQLLGVLDENDTREPKNARVTDSDEKMPLLKLDAQVALDAGGDGGDGGGLE